MNQTQRSYLRMVLNWHEHFFGNGDGRAVWFRQHQRFLLHAVHFEQAGPDFGYFCRKNLILLVYIQQYLNGIFVLQC